MADVELRSEQIPSVRSVVTTLLMATPFELANKIQMISSEQATEITLYMEKWKENTNDVIMYDNLCIIQLALRKLHSLDIPIRVHNYSMSV